MLAYIIRRVAQSILVLLIVGLVAFSMFRFVGDPIDNMLGQERTAEDIERLRREVSALMGVPTHITVAEIRKPELDAQLVAEGIAQQLERRVMFRRAMKRAVTNTMRVGAEGIKVKVGGRLNGAEIARSEWYREGRVPLHTLRADIDYGVAEAHTTYGVIGVKVWIFKGEVFGGRPEEKEASAPAKAAPRG